MLEGEHQEKIFDWCNNNLDTYPEVDLLFAIPNGVKRSKRYMAKLKRQGLKPGVLDMFLPVPRWGFNGLFIELKRPAGPNNAKGRLSTAQKEWIEKLTKQGYAVHVTYGWEETVTLLKHYLET